MQGGGGTAPNRVVLGNPVHRVGAPSADLGIDFRAFAEEFGRLTTVVERGVARLDKDHAAKEREKQANKGNFSAIGSEEEELLFVLRGGPHSRWRSPKRRRVAKG